MSYTRNSLERAVYDILPKMLEYKNEGIKVAMPELLKMAAEDFFLYTVDEVCINMKPSYDVCRVAYKDLILHGYFVYAEED